MNWLIWNSALKKEKKRNLLTQIWFSYLAAIETLVPKEKYSGAKEREEERTIF